MAILPSLNVNGKKFTENVFNFHILLAKPSFMGYNT